MIWSRRRATAFAAGVLGALGLFFLALGALAPVVVATPCGAQTNADASAPGALVATTEIQPQSYRVTLPDKVGVLLAGSERALAFEVGGRLESLSPSGSEVRAGDVVASLEASLERARLDKAGLELAQARTEWRRVQELHGEAAASQKALDRADTDLRIRKAERDIAAEQLARRQLLAPFGGVLVDNQPELGEVVNPGVRVTTLMNLGTLRLEVGVPGYQIGHVEPGAVVSIAIPALRGEEFEAVVGRVAPAAVEAGHLFEVEILLENPAGRLRPGMTARAQIVTHTLDDVLSVPLDLVVERDSRRVVFFVSDQRARAVDISEAPIHRDRVLIPGSVGWRTLVLRGQRDLREASTVRVDNAVLEGDRGA